MYRDHDQREFARALRNQPTDAERRLWTLLCAGQLSGGSLREAASVALAVWIATRVPIFAAIAGVGAWINLFNLLPIGPLDGGRGFHAMNRWQKILAAATCAGAWYATDDGLMLLALVGAGRALGDKSEQEGNWKGTITYCGLVALLTVVSTVRWQIPGGN